MGKLLLYNPALIAIAIALFFSFIALYMSSREWAKNELLVIMADVHYLGHELYHIEGMSGTFKKDKGMVSPSGFDPWRSAFMKSDDYYGPIAFDDINKTFAPINPSDATTLDRIAVAQKQIEAGELKLPVILKSYRRA